ncbi:MAG: hypothetical protein ACXWUL_01730 [Caldimonas sp.]
MSRPSRRSLSFLLAVVAVAAAGCGESVQTAPTGDSRKTDGLAWQTKETRYLAPGWTPGDEKSWNAQLVHRAQGQNDYAPRK